MHRTTTAPSPLNLVTTWFVWIVDRVKVKYQVCTTAKLLILTLHFFTVTVLVSLDFFVVPFGIASCVCVNVCIGSHEEKEASKSGSDDGYTTS